MDFVGPQPCFGMEMREQQDQRVADAAGLPASGADIRQHLLLDVGIARLAKNDVDAQLAADRTEQRGQGIDRLNDAPRNGILTSLSRFLLLPTGYPRQPQIKASFRLH
jgi:hypothetical protein